MSDDTQDDTAFQPGLRNVGRARDRVVFDESKVSVEYREMLERVAQKPESQSHAGFESVVYETRHRRSVETKTADFEPVKADRKAKYIECAKRCKTQTEAYELCWEKYGVDENAIDRAFYPARPPLPKNLKDCR